MKLKRKKKDIKKEIDLIKYSFTYNDTVLLEYMYCLVYCMLHVRAFTVHTVY